MKLHSLLLLLVVALVAGLTALNWQAMTTPVDISLGVADIRFPLGLILLGFMLALTVLFSAFAVYWQTGNLLEARRHARELRESRVRAEEAEGSRLAAVQTALLAALEQQDSQRTTAQAAQLAAIEKLGETLSTTIEESANSLAACIGEVDDKLDATKGRVIEG